MPLEASCEQRLDAAKKRADWFENRLHEIWAYRIAMCESYDVFIPEGEWVGVYDRCGYECVDTVIPEPTLTMGLAIGALFIALRRPKDPRQPNPSRFKWRRPR